MNIGTLVMGIAALFVLYRFFGSGATATTQTSAAQLQASLIKGQSQSVVDAAAISGSSNVLSTLVKDVWGTPSAGYSTTIIPTNPVVFNEQVTANVSQGITNAGDIDTIMSTGGLFDDSSDFSSGFSDSEE